MRRVKVDEVRYAGGTIATGFGVDLDTGKQVRFHGDWRPMLELQEAVQRAEGEGDLPVCEVEPWQFA